MKLIKNENSRLGIAMTEYLIILGVVALGCIAIFGLFGQEIKVVAQKAMTTLAGTGGGAADIDGSGAAGKATGMADFREGGK